MLVGTEPTKTLEMNCYTVVTVVWGAKPGKRLCMVVLEKYGVFVRREIEEWRREREREGERKREKEREGEGGASLYSQ